MTTFMFCCTACSLPKEWAESHLDEGATPSPADSVTAASEESAAGASTAAGPVVAGPSPTRPGAPPPLALLGLALHLGKLAPGPCSSACPFELYACVSVGYVGNGHFWVWPSGATWPYHLLRVHIANARAVTEDGA